jgi:antitoxin YefM
MRELSYSHARNNLKSCLDYVDENHETIKIVRKNSGNVVMISEDDYNSINETLYLLSSANNRKHLMESIKDDFEDSVTLESDEDIDNLFK